MKTQEIKKLATRFSYEDWSWLNSQVKFSNALESSVEEAEVVAWDLLTNRNF